MRDVISAQQCDSLLHRFNLHRTMYRRLSSSLSVWSCCFLRSSPLLRTSLPPMQCLIPIAQICKPQAALRCDEAAVGFMHIDSDHAPEQGHERRFDSSLLLSPRWMGVCCALPIRGRGATVHEYNPHQNESCRPIFAKHCSRLEFTSALRHRW